MQSWCKDFVNMDDAIDEAQAWRRLSTDQCPVGYSVNRADAGWRLTLAVECKAHAEILEDDGYRPAPSDGGSGAATGQGTRR